MVRPRKEIPLYHDIKCLKTLVQEGKTQEEIADYYGVDQATISRRLKKIKKDIIYIRNYKLRGLIDETNKTIQRKK
jgi:predicted transcriptional regulator